MALRFRIIAQYSVYSKFDDALKILVVRVHVPNFGGCQDRRTGVRVTTVSSSLMLGGGVGDKSFKEWRRNIGGGRVGDNNILTFLCYWLDKQMPL